MNNSLHLEDAEELARLLVPSWAEINARIDRSGAPTCRADTSLREKLRDTEAQLGELRDERVGLARAFEDAKDAYAQSSENGQNGPRYRAATKARSQLAELDAAIEGLRAGQEELLRLLGGDGNHARRGRNGNGPRNPDGSGANGWRHAASTFDLEHGRRQVTMPVSELLPPPPRAAIGGLTVTPSSGLTHPALEQPFVQEPFDTRGIGGVFPSEQLESDDAAIQDFRSGSREVEGTVERDPIATTEKAKLALNIALAVDPLRQFAIHIDSIPVKMFDYVEALTEVLTNELGKQLTKTRDAHVVNQILASAPPVGLKGADLLTQIRYGVKMSRALGCSPSVIALSPDDAEALDLATTGTDKVLIFPTRAVGGASPVWGLSVQEVPGLAAPIIMDPPVLGKMFYGSAVLRVDQASGLSTNEVRMLLEFEAILNVRSPLGAFVIEAESE